MSVSVEVPWHLMSEQAGMPCFGMVCRVPSDNVGWFWSRLKDDSRLEDGCFFELAFAAHRRFFAQGPKVVDGLYHLLQFSDAGWFDEVGVGAHLISFPDVFFHF